MRPAGSSRVAVRGLSASRCRSTNRLIASAAVRAPTAAITIHAQRDQTSAGPGALKTPPTIKGREKRVCSKRTNDAYVRKRSSGATGSTVAVAMGEVLGGGATATEGRGAYQRTPWNEKPRSDDARMNRA